ncbi:MAG TPA: VOC family protein [Acidimicrobiales bacterium]|nr:VOC family protein [Acidimicrobiales bacterium]
MSDPFEALHSPIVPTDPDPAFAADLRARVSEAFDKREAITPPASPRTATGPRHGDIGYVSLWVPDVERAGAFFSTVLGWQYTPIGARQGRQVEGSAPPHGIWGEQERSTLFLCFTVEDVDETLERVRDAGGQAGAPQDAPHGRAADCLDDQGTPFALVSSGGSGAGGQRGPANGERHGDLAYITMEVVDSVRARAFYGSVLDWRFGPGSVTDGWGVDDVVPMVGIVGQQPTATVVPMYRVDDVDAAAARVRAAGGSGDDPARQPYGVTTACLDDQGTRFWLGQL